MTRRKTARLRFENAFVLGAALCFAAAISAQQQQRQNEPATDSSTQSSPIRPVPPAPAVDSSAQASPIGSGVRVVSTIVPHTSIQVRLAKAIDSGHLKNGDIVPATLANAVALSPRGTLNAGSPAELTVVETLPAGRISAAGEFSLQLVRAGSVRVYTTTLTYRGKPGHRDVADSAPQIGTDAGLAAGAELTFLVLPPATPANGPPDAHHGRAGSVTGVAVGGSPPAGSSAKPKVNGRGRNTNGNGNLISTKPGSGKTNSSQARTHTSGSNTPKAAEPVGKNSPAPNQPSAPANATPTDSTQPHL